MICGESTIVMGRPASAIHDVIMDLGRYRQVDDKLGAIRRLERAGDTLTVRFGPRLRGVPSPVPVAQRVTLTPGARIDIRDASSWLDRFLTFEV